MASELELQMRWSAIRYIAGRLLEELEALPPGEYLTGDVAHIVLEGIMARARIVLADSDPTAEELARWAETVRQSRERRASDGE